MPALITLTLEASGDPAKVALDHVHGAACELVERALGTNHHANVKPTSVRPPRRAADGTWEVSIGIADDTLVEAALDRIVAVDQIRLGNRTFPVAGRRVVGIPWVDLAMAAEARREFAFAFRTATFFRSGQTVNPLPWASGVFGGLRRRWNEFCPPALAIELDLDSAKLEVSHLAGQTVTEQAERRSWTGFVGEVTYKTKVTETEITTKLDALALLAQFVGVGSYTTRGMGVTDYQRA